MPRSGGTFDENNVPPLDKGGLQGLGVGCPVGFRAFGCRRNRPTQKVVLCVVGSYFPLGEYFIRTSTTGLPAAVVVTLPARISTASILRP